MTKRIPPEVKKLYLAAPMPHRKTMLTMRERILEIVPKAQEVISYGMPAFKVNNNIVAGILANKKHVGYYPFSGSVLKNFKSDLANYSQTKSALHVPVDKPLTKSLIAKLVKARISQCEITQGKINPKSITHLEKTWRDMKIASPARRALVAARILKKSDLAKWTFEDLAKLHGIGKTTINRLRPYLKK
jgi:uncharacterized protein YdhG (YjbR/CyaY superfamily)